MSMDSCEKHSDLFQSRAECSHVWQDGWCSSCGLGWATWSSAEIARLLEKIRRERDEALEEIKSNEEWSREIHERMAIATDSRVRDLPMMITKAEQIRKERDALLDRLQRAEAVVEAARPFTIPEPPYGAPPPGTSAYKLFKALAAWEEGK